MNDHFDPRIRMIPVKQITVLNPRQRGKKKFAQIVANIGKLGLKKPVTVARTEGTEVPTTFTLVCGQGRLEAFIALGQEEIPALVIEGTKAELLLKSLAENLARRQHSSIELVRRIRILKEQGYANAQIAAKTDLNVSYIRAIIQLLAKGEERLLQAVEKGQVPVSIAVTIAMSDDKEIQRALTEAYERNDLRGKALLRARRLIENRRARGKKLHGGPRPRNIPPVSAANVLKTYQDETLKQKIVIQKSKICETRLQFSVAALKQLFRDDHFVTLLRAESLDTLPQYLALEIQPHEATS